MNIVDHSHRIAYLISNDKINSLNSKEKEELSEWLKQEENKKLYDKICSKNYAEKIIYNKINSYKAWDSYNKKHQKRHIKLKSWISIAASMLIIMSASTYFYFNNPTTPNEKSIIAGSSKAVLILHDGSNIQLGESINKTVKEYDKTTIAANSKLITYHNSASQQKATETELYNTLKIPTGGEFNLVMADGTKIWINSKTTIKYPVNIVSDSRNIWLDGEAYLEVKKNKDKPFFVHTKSGVKVKVLGTSFNVKSYEDEKDIQTVLVEGSVEMSYDSENKNDKIILKPGFRGSFSKKEKTITMDKVETRLYTAWKDCQFIFNNDSLEYIMRTLSRWYNINITFEEEELKQLRFTLDVKRYNKIQTILEAIQIACDLEFKIKNREIYVRKKLKTKHR